MKLFLLVISLFIGHSINAQELAEGSIWKISNRNSIVWNLAKEARTAYSDNIEMSGLNIAATALLDKLWTENGVLVELDSSSTDASVFWDRGYVICVSRNFQSRCNRKVTQQAGSFF